MSLGVGRERRREKMEDSVGRNLLAQKEMVQDLDTLLQSIEKDIDQSKEEIIELKKRSAKVREHLLELGCAPATPGSPASPPDIELVLSSPRYSYEEVTERNLRYLTERGLLDRDFDSLFTQEVLLRIERELSAPIAREKWDKWDCVAVFAGGIAGIVADTFAGGIDSALKEWLGNFHVDSPEVAIDYQGPSFGGPLHRGLSSGHDILRVFMAIWQIKNGAFVGVRQTATGFEWITKTANQHGAPFETYEALEAFLVWVKHLASDFVTPNSLPFPGMSFLMELPNREIRKFAIELYKHGYNLRFILVQTFAPALVELIVRGYVLGREFKETKAITFPSAKRLKVTELLLTAHALVAAINVGKVVIRCNAEGPIALRKLNVPSIIMTVRYFIPFIVKRMKLNDPVEIFKRNSRQIMESYDGIIAELSEDLRRDDEFKKFLENGEQIVA
jgi:hypothetical protein